MATEIAQYQKSGLPDNPTELTRFIVIAQEKAKAIRAEIQAIKRLDVAKEVYEQKLEEQARLRELMLLAYQRIGEITSELPVSVGGRPSAETLPAGGNGFQKEHKTKAEAIRELGLSTSQVNRFEKMAANPDVVEAVIEESRAGMVEATQTEVLKRIRERDGVIDLSEIRNVQERAEYRRIDRDAEALRTFRAAVDYSGLYTVTPDILDSVITLDPNLDETLENLDKTIQMLLSIKNELVKRRFRNGQKNLHSRN